MDQNTVTIYRGAKALRIVVGQHTAHGGASRDRITVWPSLAAAVVGESGDSAVLACLARFGAVPTSADTAPAFAPFRRGQRVAILNRTYSGRAILEGYAVILAPGACEGQYRVRFEGDEQTVFRFVDVAAQTDTESFVARLNAEALPHAWRDG